MKKALFIFTLTASTFSYSQTAIVSDFAELNTTNATKLHTLPWDPNSLMVVDNYLNSDLNNVYSINNITSGEAVPFEIPDCNEIHTAPVFLENGILTAGKGSVYDHALFYFDGQQTYSFDFTSLYHPSIIIRQLGNQVYVIGGQYGTRELYRFDPETIQLEQLTAGHSVYDVTCTDNGTIYFQEIVPNIYGSNDHNLYELTYDEVSQSYTSTLLKSVASMRRVLWKNPINFNGKLLLTEGGDYICGGDIEGTYAKIVEVDNGQVTDLIEVPYIGYLGYNNLFVFDNELYFYLNHGNTLYTSMDGINFDVAVQFNDPLDYISDYSISEDKQLYFIRGNNVETVSRYDQGFTDLYTADRVNFLNEFDGRFYIQSHDNTSGMRAIVLINTQWDLVEEIPVEYGNEFSYVGSSLMFDGYFTFSFSDENSTSVKQIVSTDTGDFSLFETQKWDVFPNIVFDGQSASVMSTNKGDFNVLNASGQSVSEGTFSIGMNPLNTENLQSGMYFIHSMGTTKRFVIVNN